MVGASITVSTVLRCSGSVFFLSAIEDFEQ
jgi:hypothetical protein